MHIKLENIRCLSGDFHFYSPGINIIAGDNGTGKSTLVNSIYLALFGRFPQGNLRGKNLIKKGEKSGYVYVSFNYQDCLYEAERNIPGEFRLIKDGNILDNKEVFDPEHLKYIYMSNELQRFDFSNIININTILDKGKNFIEKIVNTREEYYKKLIICKNNLERYKERISHLTNKLKELREQKIFLNEEIKETEKNIAEIKDLVDKVYDLDIDELLKFKEMSSEEINKIKIRINNISNEIKIKKIEITEKIETGTRNNLERLNNQQYEARKYLEKLDSLKDKNVCPLCNSKIEKNKIEEEYLIVNDKLKKIQENIKRILELKEEKKKEIENKIKEYLDNQMGKLNQELEEKTREFDNINRKIKEIIQEKKNIENINNRHQELILKYEKYKERMNTIDNNINESLKEIEEIKKDITTSQEDEKKLTDTVNIYNNKIEILKNKIFNMRPMKIHILLAIGSLLKNIISKYSFFKKVEPVVIIDEEKESIEIQAKNLAGIIVSPTELSQGENVIFKIYKNIITRKLYDLILGKSLPNIFIMDEMLDNLSYVNQEEVIQFISTILKDSTIIIVTHRVDTLEGLIENQPDINTIYL